ncbi:uncharacterized protein STAUR_7466 [Stigmatella aurantiaca DW4/3-1]|uniref:Uncharacterized protein n=1 Tax=Stigmatella aurantiaca (strain DW4/3-1) TaxID=378806 RepID=E3FFW3_STIAD|nr:uncharacterized protein STAUR_7466 [Stigmatella aurantiaca DW4/3-1]
MKASASGSRPYGIRLDTVKGAPREYRPPSSNQSVRVEAEAFEEVLMRWVRSAPLMLRSSPNGWRVLASYPNNGTAPHGQHLVAQVRKLFGP